MECVCWVHAIVPGEEHARIFWVTWLWWASILKQEQATVTCPSMLHYVIVFIHNGLDLYETGGI
jgi:hypothetical protein